MGKDRDDARAQERTINFALLVQQITTEQGTNYSITSQNQGIRDPDIILLVTCWLEKVQDRFKGRIKDSILFGDEPPKD